jgi:hypothetical protein
MIRKILLPSIALGAFLFINSCKKSEDTVQVPPFSPEPAPLDSIFFNPAKNTITSGGFNNFEFGFRFTVSGAGKVYKLACKMPAAGTYRVSLWDLSGLPTSVIAQANIVQTANATMTYSSITPVALATGKSYLISIWTSGNWYQIMPIAGGNFTYPMSKYSITVTGFQFITAAQNPITYPNISSTTFVSGMPDLEFKRD